MARKGLLANVTNTDVHRPGSDARADYTRRGASRSMMMSIDEMAENTKKMVAGEAIVNIDPHLIDSSFVSDRVGIDEDYTLLKEAIKVHGQTTPILLRPHPEEAGRYMIVFGHRRVRVARELGVPVRAVVKNMEQIAHVIAQGQENTARANLSFIEKALFGKKLLEMGQSRETVKSALTVDDSALSRMLSVVETVPAPVIEALGAAKHIGRDRWDELKRIVQNPAKGQLAIEIALSDELRSKEDPFGYLLEKIKARPSRRQVSSSWRANDNKVAASFGRSGKTFNISLKLKDAGEFGDYVSAHLESLYEAFKVSKANP